MIDRRIYSVLLEGDDEGYGYFVTVDVVAGNEAQAEQLARTDCAARELEIVACEDIMAMSDSRDSFRSTGVVRRYEVAYFAV